MTKTLVASPFDNSKIRQARLAWIAEVFRYPLTLGSQGLRAPVAETQTRMLGTR